MRCEYMPRLISQIEETGPRSRPAADAEGIDRRDRRAVATPTEGEAQPERRLEELGRQPSVELAADAEGGRVDGGHRVDHAASDNQRLWKGGQGREV